MAKSVITVSTDKPAQLSVPKRVQSAQVPQLYAESPEAVKTFWEYFGTQIENDHTREAYLRACYRFADWCESRGYDLIDIEPMHIAAYQQLLKDHLAIQSIKLHMSGLKKLFDYFVEKGVLKINPVSSVRKIKFSINQGVTPVLTPDEMRHLFETINISTIAGLRDRAMIAVMAYSFARVTSVCTLTVADYYTQSKRSYFKFLTKGNKIHQIPAHHTVQLYVDQYLEAAGIGEQKASPLFRRTVPYRPNQIRHQAMNRATTFQMVKRRCRDAGLPPEITNHSFRGTGITTFMENGGKLEVAAEIAGHVCPTTTKLYDRSSSKATLDEIERILY